MLKIVHDGLADALRAYDERGITIASNDDGEWARLAKIAARLNPPPLSVALLGLGFGILAQLLPPSSTFTFFEIDPIFTPYAKRHTVVWGDFRTTLTPAWDVIFNDTGITNFDFTPYLTRGGEVWR